MFGKTPIVAMILAKNYEDIEATGPMDYLVSKGAKVVIIGPDSEAITGKKGGSLKPDLTLDQITDAHFASYDLLLIPGGGAPENLRIIDSAVDFTRRFVESGRPVASICHGPQLLISANVLRGRTTTAVNKIRDDITNAGGLYVDEPLVVDGNLISSRVPADLDVFNDAMGRALGLA